MMATSEADGDLVSSSTVRANSSIPLRALTMLSESDRYSRMSISMPGPNSSLHRPMASASDGFVDALDMSESSAMGDPAVEAHEPDQDFRVDCDETLDGVLAPSLQSSLVRRL